MTVKAILARKASEGRGDGVVSVSPGQSVREAAALLARHRIGALLVCEGEAMHGIVSERDVIRAIADGVEGVSDMPVSDLMTAEVERCSIHDTAARVLAMMERGGFRHMPAMDGGRLAGLVSITDIARRRVGEAEREAESVMEYVGTNARGL